MASHDDCGRNMARRHGPRPFEDVGRKPERNDQVAAGLEKHCKGAAINVGRETGEKQGSQPNGPRLVHSLARLPFYRHAEGILYNQAVLHFPNDHNRRQICWHMSGCGDNRGTVVPTSPVAAENGDAGQQGACYWPLHSVIKWSDREEELAAIREGTHLDKIVSLAILENRPETLALIVREGGRLDTNNNPVADPLRLAIIYNRVACIRILLHYGASVWTRLACIEKRKEGPPFLPRIYNPTSDLRPYLVPPPWDWNRHLAVSTGNAAPCLVEGPWLADPERAAAPGHCKIPHRAFNVLEFIDWRAGTLRFYSKIAHNYIKAHARRERAVAAVLSQQRQTVLADTVPLPWLVWHRIFTLM